MYKSDEFINSKEKSDLIEKISSVNNKEDKPFSNTPIDPHQKDDSQPAPAKKTAQEDINLPSPVKAKKGQGLAYFYNSYIQIQGSQKLHSDDILTIENRDYILKPKNFSNKIALYSAAALLVLCVSVIGSFLIGNSGVGNGQVFGVILDENNNPYINGATVLFTELGEKSESDAQGLFTFSHIPAGSHKIEYLIDGQIIGSDYITIADNNNSSITLKPTEQIVEKATPISQLQLASADKKTVQEQTVQKKEPVKSTQKSSKKKTVAKKATTKKSTSNKSTTGYGKLALNANVDGAKIKVDGSVLGAGNITYSRIKSGKHTYTVSLDGYESASGSFTIQKGKTKKISPTLTALTKTEQEESFKGNDYFYSAETAFNNGDYKTAIDDYKKVIETTPSSVESYFGLAESYSKQKKWDLAYDNYIRAAEIHSFKGSNNHAITCYNNAIEVDDKTFTAYLGRGHIYLNSGEYRAALGDFDKVVKIDKRNFDGYYGMGEASFKLQRFTKALKYFKDARSLNKENPQVHQYLTLSYMFEHDRKNTKKSFEKFNQFASENEKIRFKKNSQYSAVTKYIDSE